MDRVLYLMIAGVLLLAASAFLTSCEMSAEDQARDHKICRDAGLGSEIKKSNANGSVIKINCTKPMTPGIPIEGNDEKLG